MSRITIPGNASDLSGVVRSVMPALRNVTASTALALNDDYVRVNANTAVNVTVPTNTTAAFAAGSVLTVRRVGAGAVTIVPASGVTLNGSLTGVGQNASYSLIKVGLNEWDVEGGA